MSWVGVYSLGATICTVLAALLYKQKNAAYVLSGWVRWREWAGLQRLDAISGHHGSAPHTIVLSSTANRRWVYITTYTTGHGTRIVSTRRNSKKKDGLPNRGVCVRAGRFICFNVLGTCYLVHS